MTDFMLLETGDKIILEDGSGFLLLETAGQGAPNVKTAEAFLFPTQTDTGVFETSANTRV